MPSKVKEQVPEQYMSKEQAKALVNSIVSLIPEGMSIRLELSKSDLALMFMTHPKSEVYFYLTCRGNELGITLEGRIFDLHMRSESRRDDSVLGLKDILRDCNRLIMCGESIVKAHGIKPKSKKPKKRR